MNSKKINFSEIPELSDRQLSTMRRVGRPTVGEEPRKLIAIRLDAKVFGLAAQDRREKRAAVPIVNKRNPGRRDAEGELTTRFDR
jgi:hypothetical protein